MTLSTKILIFLGTVVTLGLLTFIVYKQMEISNRQQAIETQMVAQKQLVDGIVRSSSQWSTKDDLLNFAKENNINIKAIQDDLAKLHADITAINVTVSDSLGQHGSNVPSTGTGENNPNPPTLGKCQDGTECPNLDPWNYQKSTQLLSLNEDFGSIKLPFASVGFSAWKQFPWSFNVLPREYKNSVTVGVDENERNYFYSKFSIKVGDKEYDVPISTATSEQIYPEAKWSFWNPRLFIGADAGINLNQTVGEFIPSLSMGVISYGKFKTSPTISVLEVGAGYGVVSKKPQLVVTPFAYNLGQFVPIIKNTYIAPALSVGTNGEFTVTGGVRVGL